MSNLIAVALPPLSREQDERLKNETQKLGYELRICQRDNITADETAGCEIFFGMFPRKVVKATESLKWMHCHFAGVDKYTSDDIYPNPNVVLTNSSGAYGITISEHMICVTLMMMRRMPEYIELQKNCDWTKLGEVKSIYGSTFAIVGVGDLGSSFAKRVKALGGRTIGVRRRLIEKPDCFDEMYTSDNIEHAVSGADVIAFCLPETNQTSEVFNAALAARLKDGAYVINVGRGSAVNQQALYLALMSGKLAGAAIDVTYPEPLPPDSPLWGAPNMILTPHVSGNTSLSRTRDIIIDIFLENLRLYKEKKPLLNVVDRKAGY